MLAITEETLMRLQRMASLCALIVALFSTSAAAQGTPASSSTDRSPEIVVKEFYKWYIHSVSHQIDPFKTDKPTLKKFVTTRLILKIERIAREMASGGYDSDYFVEAQRDYPDSPNLEDEWMKNVSVSKTIVRGTAATLTVSFGENGALAKERVSLVQEGGVWKIDNVKAVSPQPN
jgi:hypothetical protein